MIAYVSKQSKSQTQQNNVEKQYNRKRYKSHIIGRKEYFETKVYRFVNFALYLLFWYTSKWGYDNY